jgi:hypothetical protein
MSKDLATDKYLEKLLRLYPIGGKPLVDPVEADHHLASVVMVLIFHEQVLTATFPPDGPPDVDAFFSFGYPFDRGDGPQQVSDDDIADLGRYRREFRAMSQAWSDITGQYEPGACPSVALLRRLVEFTKTFSCPE